MSLALASPTLDEPPAFLLVHTRDVDSAMRRLAPSARGRAGEMVAYHMGWVDAAGRPCPAGGEGKRLRSGLLLWAAEAVGGTAEEALRAAVAVEWVHNFTLVHDDIQDGDRTRHGRPTLWTVVGTAQAINAGDAMYAYAQALLNAPGRRPGRRLRAAAAIARGTLQVIEGQCLDLALEGGPPAGVSRALRVARAKTGALFGAALEAGALLGGARVSTAAALRRVGCDLGAAFQVRDDWLGTWGNPVSTGKSRTVDLERRKQTYALSAACDAAPPSARRRLRTLVAGSDAVATAELAELLDALGAGPATAAAARDLGAAAVVAMAAIDLSARRRAEFGELVEYATTRNR